MNNYEIFLYDFDKEETRSQKRSHTEKMRDEERRNNENKNKQAPPYANTCELIQTAKHAASYRRDLYVLYAFLRNSPACRREDGIRFC